MPKRVKQSTDTAVDPEALPPRPKGWTAYMRAMGAKGGRVSGARRMTNLTAKERTTIARHAARTRWAKKKVKDTS